MGSAPFDLSRLLRNVLNMPLAEAGELGRQEFLHLLVCRARNATPPGSANACMRAAMQCRLIRGTQPHREFSTDAQSGHYAAPFSLVILSVASQHHGRVIRAEEGCVGHDRYPKGHRPKGDYVACGHLQRMLFEIEKLNSNSSQRSAKCYKQRGRRREAASVPVQTSRRAYSGIPKSFCPANCVFCHRMPICSPRPVVRSLPSFLVVPQVRLKCPVLPTNIHVSSVVQPAC
jgi:hypothetical protein